MENLLRRSGERSLNRCNSLLIEWMLILRRHLHRSLSLNWDFSLRLWSFSWARHCDNFINWQRCNLLGCKLSMHSLRFFSRTISWCKTLFSHVFVLFRLSHKIIVVRILNTFLKRILLYRRATIRVAFHISFDHRSSTALYLSLSRRLVSQWLRSAKGICVIL